MSIPNLHEMSLVNAQLRAVAVKMRLPEAHSQPVSSVLAAVAKHGGMYTLLDSDLMTARLSAFVPESSTDSAAAKSIAAASQQAAANFFYKLDDRPGYDIHSELMAYLTEPGNGNGILYNEGEQPSPDVPAAFTFVGQFLDHDLTCNPMNLTADEDGVVVQDDASPLIDLDSVYGPREKVSSATKDFYSHIFDKDGNFHLRKIADVKHGFDLPRHTDPNNSEVQSAYILDPRNDENQLILQIHILIERLHNAIRNDSQFAPQLAGLHKPGEIINRVRREVVATWQSFVLNDYMPAILDAATLAFVLRQINIAAVDLAHPEQQYGELKHKPYRDLVTGRNVVRMPHEFAIGFRFGHSQLRPAYLLNNNNVVLLFKDARHSDKVQIEGNSVAVSGKDDLRGSRKLQPNHVLDWDVFYPQAFSSGTASMLIDGKVTARVFNLPESAVPDDVKYIGNLAHRNLIRSSQIGIVSGEELADFYGIARLTPDQILSADDRPASRKLFELDIHNGQAQFKTPLWYYLLKEAEIQNNGSRLGKLGSRLVGEVLAGAIYYGNDFPYDPNWESAVMHKKQIKLRNIIAYVNQ